MFILLNHTIKLVQIYFFCSLAMLCHDYFTMQRQQNKYIYIIEIKENSNYNYWIFICNCASYQVTILNNDKEIVYHTLSIAFLVLKDACLWKKYWCLATVIKRFPCKVFFFYSKETSAIFNAQPQYLWRIWRNSSALNSTCRQNTRFVAKKTKTGIHFNWPWLFGLLFSTMTLTLLDVNDIIFCGFSFYRSIFITRTSPWRISSR